MENMIQQNISKPIGYGRYKMKYDVSGCPVDATILDVNPSFEEYFGQKRCDLLGISKMELFSGFYGDQSELWLKKYDEVATNQNHFTEVVYYEALDTYFEINVSSPVKGEFFTFFQDITAKWKNDKMYLDILKHTSDSVFVTNDDGNFKFISPSVFKIFGETVEDCKSYQNIDFLLGNQWREKLTSEVEEIKNHEQSIINKNGVEHDLLINITRAKIGEGSILFVCHDVTDKNQALKQVRFQKNMLRAVLDTIPDCIWMKDKEGKYLICNREFELFYGAKEEEIVGKTDRDFVSESLADFFRENDLKAMRMNKPRKNEETLTYKTTGNEIRVETTKAPFYNAEGNIIGVLGIARDITHRDKIQAELKSSKMKIEQLINTVNGIIWEADPKTLKTTFISGKVKDIFGYTQEEWINMPDSSKKYIYKPDQKMVKRRFDKELKYGNSFNHDYRIVTKDQSVLWVREYVSILTDEQSVPVQIVGIVVNVNEQVRDKQELEKYQQFFNISKDNFCIADANGILTELNPQFPKTLGYTMEELKGTEFLKFVHEEDVQSTINELKNLGEGKHTINFKNRYYTKGGDIKYFDWNSTPYNDQYFAVARDITKEVKASKKFSETEFKYRNLIEAAGDAIYLLDHNGNILDINNKVAKMTGYKRIELINKFIGIIETSFRDLADFKQRSSDAQSDAVSLYDSYHTGKNGESIPVELSISTIKQSDKNLYFVIARDISERKKAKKELAKREQMLIEAQKIAKLGSWQYDIHQKTLTCSDQVYKLFDVNPEEVEVSRETYFAYIHPEEKKIVEDCFEKGLTEQKPFSHKHRIITARGAVKYVEENTSFEFDSDGNIIQVKGTIQDITKTEIYQMELQLQDKNLEKFFEYVNIGIAKNSINGDFVEINPEFERLTGYTCDELNQLSYWDLTPEKYMEMEEVQLKSLEETGRYGPYRKEYINKSGEFVPILLYGVKVTDATGKEYIWSVVQDITESVNYQNQLKQDLEKFRLMLEVGKLIAFEVDLKTGSITTLRQGINLENNTFPLEQLKSFGDFISAIRSEHRTSCQRKVDAMLKGDIDNFVCDFQIIKNKNYFWHRGVLSVLETDKNKIPCKVFVTLRNIEEEKNEEVQSLVNQEMERLRISRDIHDSIGQMLVGTRLTLKIKMGEQEGLNEIDELLDDMIKESRMIINNFGISLQKSDSLKDSFTSLAEKMHKVYQGSITINWHGNEKVEDLKKATSIFRIYQESLSNAIKYSRSPEIRVNVRNYDILFMDITDSGVGFDQNTVQSGFGTANMIERAKEIGATVKVESKIDVGTAVRFRYKR